MMYLENAPLMKLSPMDKTLFKKVINGTLFKEVAFYSSLEEVSHIMGYIGHKELQRRIMINYLERGNKWSPELEQTVVRQEAENKGSQRREDNKE